MFRLSTTIVIKWLMYSNRLSCLTSPIGLLVSTERISIGVMPSVRSSLERSLFSSKSQSPAGKNTVFVVICLTLIPRLFHGNYGLATLCTTTVSRRRRARLWCKCASTLPQYSKCFFHTALDCFRTPTDGLTTEQLLEECQRSSEDLCTMLFEYFGKHIVQPRRDLFEKATKMKVSESCDTGFLTHVEASTAMETCKQIELF